MALSPVTAVLSLAPLSKHPSCSYPIHSSSLCCGSSPQPNLKLSGNSKNQKRVVSMGAHGRFGESRGGSAILERPTFDQSQIDRTPEAEQGGDIGRLSEKKGTGSGDRYRVLLLDHERHTEKQVVTVLPKVVPSVTAEDARKCFHESRQTGVSLVIVAVKVCR